MKRQKYRYLSLLLSFSLSLGLLNPISAKAAEGEWNLALEQPVTASSIANNSGPGLAVDGNQTAGQWNSENMKSGNDVNQVQSPQWLTVDLGATGSEISQIKLWYNMKVWPMVYEIQTTDDDPTSQNVDWTTVVRVEREPFDGAVKNAEGQNIADETGNTNPGSAANTDTITTSSVPALTTTTLKRYVRFYVEKVNTAAPGNNVNLREIEILGTNSERIPVVDLTGSLNGITANSLTVKDNRYQVPAFSVNGANLVIRGSEFENVVANDGTISQWNIGSRDVSLLLRATAVSDIYNYVEKNVTVTVPDHSSNYPAEWFPTVTTPNEKPEVVPTIQEWYGYEGNFVLNANSKIVLNDAANVGLQKAAENMKADIAEISGIDLEIVTGTAPGGANDIYIESLTDANKYDLGKEGYLMVTNDKGIQIYAPTYTGCLFGTITVEQMLWMAQDHVSVPKGIMRDYPAYEVRGIKLDIARTPYRYQQLKDYAKIMLWYKMSEYGLHINDNDNANIGSANNSATTEKHVGFHRLESDRFPSLVSETKYAGIPAEVVNEDYYNNNADYQGNPTYTKEQWKALTELTSDYGMHLLTEIDLPGHSLLYNKYAEENPDNIDWLEGGTAYTLGNIGSRGGIELLDLTGSNAERAMKFAETLWDEYTDPEDPTIYGDIIHIGADEYWDHSSPGINDAFARFADNMRKVIQGNLGEDTKIRMWGASTTGFSTATTALGMTHQELAENYQLDIWHTNYDNPKLRMTEGYEVVNCRDAFVYGNPGRINRDVPNAEYLFNDWNPTNFGANNPSIGEPNLLGAKAVIWGDQSQEGMTERDIHQRVLRAISIISEKTWNGTDEEDTYAEFEIRTGHLAEGPGTQIAMELESESSLVLDYNFENISSDGKVVYDASGNGYDGNLNGGSATEGWLTFDGETLLTTPLKTLSYPYTVSFDLQLSEKDGASNSKESSLFSGYDGRIQAAGYNGNLSADVNYFTRNFNYKLPTDNTKVNITLVGTFQATRLYVNGELTTFLYQENVGNDGVAPGNIASVSASVLLPLEKIGQDFNGKMANLKVYNKALTAEEIGAAADDGKVNVAQNTFAGGSSYKSGDVQDNGVQRTSIAMKAIDGDGFTGTTGTPNHATSEQTSYWQGDHADSALTIDLGEVRSVSSIGIQWRADGKGNAFKILTSMDGENWDVAKEITGNTDYFQTIELDAPVDARYVKMQGVSGTYKIQEFMVYEQVNKTALATALTKAQKVVEDKKLSFESVTTETKDAFQSYVLAQALNNSPLATQSEVDASVEELTSAITILEHEHSYADWTVVKAATCTEAGTKEGKCSCGETKIEIEDALGHAYAATFTVDKAATCTTVGSQSKHCTRTGCTSKTEVTEIAKLAHSYGAWEETKAATCAVEGSKIHTCACGATETETIAKLSTHTWDAGVVTKKPTVKGNGIKTYTCSVCKTTKTEKVAALGAPKKGTTLKFKNNVYKVVKSALKGGTVTFVSAKKNSKSIVVPATIKVDGITYNVVSIEKNAFKNQKKVTQIAIGKNVTKIGTSVFSGCSKLKKITIQTTKLKAKGITKNAFKGIKKSTTIQVPKSKVNNYKKLFRTKGLSAQVKVLKM